MTEVLAVAFDDMHSADEVLNRLRGLESGHPVELDDACIAQRDEAGRLHLKQAIGRALSDALHARFWHDLVPHILHHGALADIESGDHCRLDRSFCCDLADALKPGTSALFVLLRQTRADSLVKVLGDHPGRILRSTLPEHEREALEVAVGMRPPPPRRRASCVPCSCARKSMRRRLGSRSGRQQRCAGARRLSGSAGAG